MVHLIKNEAKGGKYIPASAKGWASAYQHSHHTQNHSSHVILQLSVC